MDMNYINTRRNFYYGRAIQQPLFTLASGAGPQVVTHTIGASIPARAVLTPHEVEELLHALEGPNRM